MLKKLMEFLGLAKKTHPHSNPRKNTEGSERKPIEIRKEKQPLAKGDKFSEEQAELISKAIRDALKKEKK